MPSLRNKQPLFVILYSLFSLPLFVFPASQNYRLNEWAVGAGGSDRSQSANYQTETISDPTAGNQGKSTNYQINPGLLSVQMANVPPAPTLTNQNDNYDRLHLVIATGNNPTNAMFAVAISDDNFLTTYYVKADNTVSPSLVSADWRDYSSWGGATGIDILGLSADTRYYVKVKAERGDFTESGWGPLANETTSPPTLTFDIDVAPTDQETDSPYLVNLGELDTDAVTTATDKIWVDFATNANSGGVVYVGGTAGGLHSQTANYTIAAISANLDSQPEGFGLNNTSITQTTGGPFTADAPFTNSGNTVGSTGTSLVPLNTSLAPLTGGRSSQDIKAIISSMTPAGVDYSETLSLVAAGTF